VHPRLAPLRVQEVALAGWQGTGLALHNEIADHDLPYPRHALGELDGPVLFLFAAHGAAQVDHPPSGRHLDG
jgi:hypothetical protein